jgi:hypothetical protein
MTRKIIKKEMHESKSGEIYEVTHFEETFEHEGEDIVQDSIRISKTPYKADQEVEVTVDTKSLIEKIAKGNSQ